MHVKPRVRPGEHAARRLGVEEAAPHEPREHRAAERFGERGDVVERQLHERAVGPKAAVGDQQVEVRMPVGQGAVRLDRGDDADGEVALAKGGADERGDGAGGDPGQLTEQRAVVEEQAPQALGYGEHHLAVRDRREQGLWKKRWTSWTSRPSRNSWR